MFIEQFDDATERRVLALARRFGLNPVTDRSKLTHLVFEAGLALLETAANLAEAQNLLSRQGKSGHEAAPGGWVGRDPND